MYWATDDRWKQFEMSRYVVGLSHKFSSINAKNVLLGK